MIVMRDGMDSGDVVPVLSEWCHFCGRYLDAVYWLLIGPPLPVAVCRDCSGRNTPILVVR